MCDKKKMLTVLIYISLALLSACSSSSNPESVNVESKFSYFGTIRISDSTVDVTYLSFTVDFDEYVPTITSDVHSMLAPVSLYDVVNRLQLDSCAIRDIYTPSNDAIFEVLLGLDVNPTRFDVSAGSPIVVNKGFDPIVEITGPLWIKGYSFPASEYTSDLNLTVDVPGNVFPTMNVDIPNLDKLIISGSDYLPMSIGSSILWLPDSDDSTHIMLDMSGFSTAMPSDEQRIFCKITDDGLFTLPTEMITQFNEAGVSVPEFTTGRISRFKMKREERTTSSVLILRYSDIRL